jgi:hypothetical protein
VDARVAAPDDSDLRRHAMRFCLWPLGWQGHRPRRDAVLGPACCVVLFRLSSFRVSSLAACAVESLARVVHGLETAVLHCVVWLSASFSYKLANFPLLNEKKELLPGFSKK